MVSRKGRTKGLQKGMALPKGITSSRPTTLWKMIEVLKEGPADYRVMTQRLQKRWRNYPSPHSLYTTLSKRTDVFIVVDDRGNKASIYDLKEEIKNAMD